MARAARGCAALGAGALALACAADGATPGPSHIAQHLGPSQIFGERAKLRDSKGVFGYRVAMDGDTIAVGGDDVRLNDFTGAVYVYRRTGASWEYQAMVTPSDGAANDGFGWSIALSGDTMLIGTVTPAAYVFVRNGEAWTEQQKLEGWFGGAVSGDTALVSDGDSVVAFERAGTTWTEQQRLEPSGEILDGGPGPSSTFGGAIALDGDTALIGSGGESGYQGAAYVFVHDGTVWAQQARLVAADPTDHELFGSVVSVQGGTALVGAPGSSTADAHRAFVFARTGTSWRQEAELRASDDVPRFFGGACAVVGDTALVGAAAAFGKSPPYPVQVTRGGVYVFVRSGTTWIERQKLVASDGAEKFGDYVALSNDTAVIGTRDDLLAPRGVAYVFTAGDPVGAPCVDGGSCANGACTSGACACIDTHVAPCPNGYACVAGACVTSCAMDADCATGFFCRAPACESPIPDAGADGPSLADASAPEASPDVGLAGAAGASGAAGAAGASGAAGAAGSFAGGHDAGVPRAESADDGGCGCRLRGARRSGAAVGLALIGLLPFGRGRRLRKWGTAR